MKGRFLTSIATLLSPFGRLALAGTLALAVTASGPARADFVFADFDQAASSPNTDPFVFTNNTTGATFTASTPITNFKFDAIPGAPSGLQSGTLTLNASTNIPAQNLAGTLLQPISGTMSILSTGGQNLLTVTFNGLILAAPGSVNGSLQASTASIPGSVSFSSDFLNFAGTGEQAVNLTFPNMNPAASLGAGNFLTSFVTDALGTFTTTTAPTAVPEPSSVVLLGGGLLVGLFVARKRARTAA